MGVDNVKVHMFLDSSNDKLYLVDFMYEELDGSDKHVGVFVQKHLRKYIIYEIMRDIFTQRGKYWSIFDEYGTYDEYTYTIQDDSCVESIIYEIEKFFKDRYGKKLDFIDFSEMQQDEAIYEFFSGNDKTNPNAIYNQLEAINKELAQIKSSIERELADQKKRDMILTGLLQALAEKFCPDSLFVKSLKSEMEKSSFEEDEAVAAYADELVESVLQGCQEEDQSLPLFAYVFGCGRKLPKQTDENHYRYMIKAVYRYYNRTLNEKVKECFIGSLSRAATLLSSPYAIDQLNEVSGASITVMMAVDMFFQVILSQMDFEQSGVSPLRIDNVDKLINSFINAIKSNPQLCDNDELIAKINMYEETLYLRYGIKCSVN